MSKLSVSEAVERYPVSQATLYRDLKAGKVSHSKNAKGKRVIDAAEMERVYGKPVSSNGTAEGTKRHLAEGENANGNSHLSQEREETREVDKDKLIALLENQLEHERAEKSKLLDMLAMEQEKTKMLMLPPPEKKRPLGWLGYFRRRR